MDDEPEAREGLLRLPAGKRRRLHKWLSWAGIALLFLTLLHLESSADARAKDLARRADAWQASAIASIKLLQPDILPRLYAAALVRRRPAPSAEMREQMVAIERASTALSPSPSRFPTGEEAERIDRILRGEVPRAPKPKPKEPLGPDGLTDVERETGLRLDHSPVAGPPRGNAWVMASAAPLLSVVDALFSSGGWPARIVLLGQILLGLCGAIYVLAAVSRRIGGFSGIGGFIVLCLVTPPLIVALGSASAYATHLLMAGTAFAFSPVSKLLPPCISAGGVCLCCYSLVMKALDTGGHRVLHGVIGRL